MKGNQHVYECQVQIDQKCCVCALYKNRGNCNHLNGAGYRWINDNCLNCGADLTGAKPAKAKTDKIELLKNEPQFTKHASIYKKVNEIINHLNSKPEN